MIIAIDVGNSNIVIGVMTEEEILFSERISTDRKRTALEYEIIIKNILDIHDIDRKQCTGGIISSVVPEVTYIMQIALKEFLHIDAKVVGPGLKTGLAIRIDNPAQLGANLLVGAVAALDEYSVPFVVLDMGTATSLGVVNKNRQYVGGMVYPGLVTGLNSLVANTSLLQQIDLVPPKKIIGSNTSDAMKSGVLYGNAVMVDGLIRLIEEELGEECTVVATGGLAHVIAPLCSRQVEVDDDLLLKGLRIIYKKNIDTKK